MIGLLFRRTIVFGLYFFQEKNYETTIKKLLLPSILISLFRLFRLDIDILIETLAFFFKYSRKIN